MNENEMFTQVLRIYDGDDPTHTEARNREMFVRFGYAVADRLRINFEKGVCDPICVQLKMNVDADYDALREKFYTERAHTLKFLNVETRVEPPIPVDPLPFIETKRLLRELWKRPFRWFRNKK